MRRTTVNWTSILMFSVLAVSCNRSDTNLTEIQRIRSGMLDVVLLSRYQALRHGKDAFTVEFRSASDGHLVDVGNVRAAGNMPMPGMPMFGSIEVQQTKVPGRYVANSDIGMAGAWRLTIEWNGSAGVGSVSFVGTVQ